MNDEPMQKFAVIVAGGMGKRMGNTVPKQFLLIHDKPVLWYTLETFLRAYDDLHVILVLPNEFIQKGKQITASFGEAAGRITIAQGGSTRFNSVQEGLKLVKTPSVIFVHDGVRCLISIPLIHRCYMQALEVGSAIPAVAVADSIRISEGGDYVVKDRNQVRIIQTPQTFKSELLLPAFQLPFQESFTDEATVVEAYGKKIYLTEGEYDNIKITRPIDIVIAEKIIENRLSLKEPDR